MDKKKMTKKEIDRLFKLAQNKQLTTDALRKILKNGEKKNER